MRDFEEEQSEKENQIHHLKTTATNTIRNLYALNGMSSDNLMKSLDTQELKNRIPGKGFDQTLKDPKKRVSFEGIQTRYLSTLSRTGDRGDVNETIDMNKSQKLMSPHRKRTAAYTQATKSSMKKGKSKRDSSAQSANKNRDTNIAPLGPSTPAKFTGANKSTVGKFEKVHLCF